MEAQARVEELRAYMLQEGITADRMVARGFAYEGYENLREGNYERAREAFDLSRSFDPYLPEAQYGYAWSLLRAGRGLYPFLTEYRRGLALAWARFRTDEAQVSNMAVVAVLGLLCGAVVLSLVVIARCQSRVRHDLSEMLRGWMPEGPARFGAWLIFLLPVLLWVGGIWLLLYWLVLCFRYMRLAEKTVAAGVFVMIGLSPLGVLSVIDGVQASTDPEIRVVVSALQAGYNPETVRQLKQVVAVHDNEEELHLLLGTAYARGDLLGEAFDEYQRVLDGNPSNAAALIDVGNIYYRLGEWAQAANHYKKAGQIQPDLVSAYWNLYLAQTELFHFSEADASLAQARHLDPVLTGRLLAQKKGEQIDDLLLEEPASLPRIKATLRRRPDTGEERAAALGSAVSVASGAALLLALVLGSLGGAGCAAACSRCGRPHCRRCRVDRGGTELCSRCVHLFVKKEGMTTDVRSAGLARLQRRDRLTALMRRFLSILLPGAGQILAGRLALGIPLMLGWVVTIIFLLARDRLLQPPRVPVTDLAAPGLVTACCLLALFWIVGNTTSTRRRAMPESVHGS